jgi:hypothetical protein
MTNLKSVSAKRLVANIVEKMPTILGCLFFLFSLILPFYSTTLVTLGGSEGPTYYRSFEADSHISGPLSFHPHVATTQYWFFDYWLNHFPTLNLGRTLMLMFVIQALTLFSCIAYFFEDRRVLPIASILLCSAVIALMIYTSITFLRPSYLFGDYEQGYYLIYPSLVMFVLAFMRNEITTRGQMSKRFALKND